MIDQLDLRKFEKTYRSSGKGELPYPPRMLLKILIYSYATGVFSSRKIARQIEENIALRVLAAGHSPSHRTICRFRTRHIDSFEAVFLQILEYAQEAGLVKMGTIAIDGSKFGANASKHKAMSYARMEKEEKRLRGEIRRLTRAAAGEDELEDAEFGPEFRGDELPEELQRRESRLKAIQAAKKRLEERKAFEAKVAKARKAEKKAKAAASPSPRRSSGRPPAHPPDKPKPKDQENFTDPDSRIMKTSSGGFEQCYNAQVAVDDEAQLIVGASISQSAADCTQLIPMVEQAIKNTGLAPQEVLADAGYRSEDNFIALEAQGIEAAIPLGRDKKKLEKAKPNKDLEATCRMHQKMKGKRARKRYKRRKHIVEPIFGWMKAALGFRRFQLRGLDKVSGEWSLACVALNIKTLSTRMKWA